MGAIRVFKTVPVKNIHNHHNNGRGCQVLQRFGKIAEENLYRSAEKVLKSRMGPSIGASDVTLLRMAQRDTAYEAMLLADG